MSDSENVVGRTAREYVDLIRQGTLSSVDLVQHCLDAIDKTDGEIAAWVWLDREGALEQARQMDEIRRHGKPMGKLHGLPIGLKDIIDTAGVPTERGTQIFKGRVPNADAAVVEKLKEAGAVVLGKTVTTEMAFMEPAQTRNPHNTEYGPGGSSAGSAAAVAAGQIPIALGSQTNGSTIRPASFCGVYGYKPSRGMVSRRGLLETSPSLDQVGIFALDASDLAFICDAISGYDAADKSSYLRPRPDVLSGYLSEVPVEPTFAYLDLPYGPKISSDVSQGFDEIIELLGNRVDRLSCPKSFVGLIESLRIIYGYELYHGLERLRDGKEANLLSDTFKAALETGAGFSTDQYDDACLAMNASGDWFAEFFNDFDAILTPSALSEAPKSGDGTGDPICCTIWTLAGLPCVNLPLLTGENNMPVGVQLVGGLNEDDRLFRTTRWLLDFLRDDNQ